MRRFAFFNKVSPPRVFAALEIRADLPENNLFSLWSTCEWSAFEVCVQPLFFKYL
jgi:hypothetical protein